MVNKHIVWSTVSCRRYVYLLYTKIDVGEHCLNIIKAEVEVHKTLLAAESIRINEDYNGSKEAIYRIKYQMSTLV